MDIRYFLFEDKLSAVKSQFQLRDGWLKIFENEQKSIDDTAGLYCCLISNSKLSQYRNDSSWPLYMGREGKASVYGDNSYRTNDTEGLEPFLFYKSFMLEDSCVSYIDVSEEFILYFKLYEKGDNKQDRSFYYVSDYGVLDEVIKIEQNQVKIKIKYLKEYITIRDMHFVVCFDFMRLCKINSPEDQVAVKDEIITEGDYVYNHLIREMGEKMQSWIMGNLFIKPNAVKKTHLDSDFSRDEDFIVGFDENGELLYRSCGDDNSHFDLTYFKKEVLDKYYNDPSRSALTDSMSVQSSLH